jgi:hypothetical protein
MLRCVRAISKDGRKTETRSTVKCVLSLTVKYIRVLILYFKASKDEYHQNPST